MRPYSESCDQNREPILAAIAPLFTPCHRVLEIGSGTGQHAVYFAEHLPHLVWQTSDLPEHHAGIQSWLDEAALPNVRSPLIIDAHQSVWPDMAIDAIFTANTFHIMDWSAVEGCMAGAGRLLPAGGLLVVYGPFNYNGEYTSESNARFDRWLKQRDPDSGVRDFDAVNRLAASEGLELQEDVAMPANNRILCWRRGS